MDKHILYMKLVEVLELMLKMLDQLRPFSKKGDTSNWMTENI
jgi:hypothetical protein